MSVTIDREEPTVGTRDGDPVSAMWTATVAERKRRDDQIALRHVADVAARFLNHADELVTDRTRLKRRVATVIPEIGSADAGQYDPDDGIGGLANCRVGPVAGLIDRGS